MKPHKHAELIKAWADGAEIQREMDDGSWVDDVTPSWFIGFYYRIKPEPIDIDYKMKNMKEEALKIANELAFQPSELSMWDRNIAANMIHDLLEELEQTKQKYKSMHNLATQSMSQVHQLEKDKSKEYNSITAKILSDEEIYDLWCDADNTECMPEMRNKDGSVNYIITTFAELIIKASRGEE